MNKLIVLTAALAACVAAKADEEYQCLYWQVQADKVASGVADYNAAYLYVLDGDNVKLNDGNPISVTGWDTMQTADSRVNSEIVGTADLSAYSTGSYGFLLELANWGDDSSTMVGKSEVWSFDTLKSYMTTVKGGSNIPTQGVWAPMVNVPEPTSGLLMLLGIAGLALRRKRA